MAWYLETEHDGARRDPTWTQIHDALLRLDGEQCSEVVVRREGTGSLVIGGGNTQRYIVVFLPEATSEGAAAVTLVDETPTGPEVTLKVQTPSAFPARMAVPLPLVLQVVEHYYHSGELLTSVEWEP